MVDETLVSSFGLGQGMPRAPSPDQFGGNTRHDAVCLHVFDDDRPGSNGDAVPDLDVANEGIGSYQTHAADHALTVDTHVWIDHGELPNANFMPQHDMDVDPGEITNIAAQGQIRVSSDSDTDAQSI